MYLKLAVCCRTFPATKLSITMAEQTASESMNKMAGLASVSDAVLTALRTHGFTSADKISTIFDGAFIKPDASLDALMNGQTFV
jgi:hypothetical protein